MKTLRIWVLLLLVNFLGSEATVVPIRTQDATPEGRSARALVRVSLDDREKCQPGDNPVVRVNTTERVAALRQEMENYNLTAYVIPSGDEHQSEYVAQADERRRYVSGFSGSSGIAVVTSEEQALWTDGRYFLQAEEELDCNWILMKEGMDGVPTVLEWLQQLPSGSRVGADPRLIGAPSWLSYASALEDHGIEMIAEEDNLIDIIWTQDGRPPYVQDPLFVHEIEFAGKTWQSKISDVRQAMSDLTVDLFVISALDEVAWLLNLRGSDIPYNPIFRAYVVVSMTSVDLFLPPNKVTEAVNTHLSVNDCTQECVTIHDYEDILMFLQSTSASKILIPGAYAYSGGASYAIYSSVPESSLVIAPSPVLLMKAQKNEVEIRGMRNAHLKDAVALCDFLMFLEKEITQTSNEWTEISAASKLEEYRSQQDEFVGLSFGTISGFGANGAIIHYEASAATDTRIDNSSMYLLDSGGQYKDGTTDVTRTFHYGTPTPEQVEMYTRVLAGHIDLASVTFPQGTTDTRLDILARRHLYEIGLDYRHGTGHGIGMFLGVHESPTQIRIYGVEDHPFQLGYFQSDEPGYYKDNEYGIRLENIVVTVLKNTTYTFDRPFFGFDPVTLVPFEAKLINEKLLTSKQCDWLNKYHATVLDKVGTEMHRQGRHDAYVWLESKTQPLCLAINHSPSLSPSLLVTVIGLMVALRMYSEK